MSAPGSIQVKASRNVAAPVRASAGASASVARRSVTVSMVSCAGFGAQDLMVSMDMEFLASMMVADAGDSGSVEDAMEKISGSMTVQEKDAAYARTGGAAD